MRAMAACFAMVLGTVGAVSAHTPVVSTAGDLPDLAVPDHDLGDINKYVVMVKPDVSFDQAQRDLGFCWRFLARGAPRSTPGFIPWPLTEAARRERPQIGSYGLAGAVIGAALAGPIDRSLRQNRMFRCMLPRGYERYRTSQAVWMHLNSGDDDTAIDAQPRIASGPVPPTPRVQP